MDSDRVLPSSADALIFRASLLYQRVAVPLLGRQWYNRIDENVVLGALPLDRTMIETLQRRENVAAVINVCRKHEWVVPDHDPESLYSELGIAYLSLPTVDFQVPTVEAVTSGIQFIERCIKSNPSSGVYIHCKAGKGRSATLGLCYLIWRYGLAPREAQARLLASRPQVDRDICESATVAEFWATARENGTHSSLLE